MGPEVTQHAAKRSHGTHFTAPTMKKKVNDSHEFRPDVGSVLWRDVWRDVVSNKFKSL